MEAPDIYTIIDIGTEAIRVAIARAGEDSRPQLLGTGDTHSNRLDHGLPLSCNIRKGEPRNAEGLAEQLMVAVTQAEQKAGCRAADGRIYLTVTGDIHTINTSFKRKLSTPDGLVSENDIVEITRLARECSEFTANTEEACIQTYTRYYVLDDGREVENAIGLSTRELGISVQGVMLPRTGKAYSLQQLIANQLHCQPILLYTPMTMGYALNLERGTDDDDLKAGFLVIDIGAGVTSFCVCFGGCFVHMGHLPVGCNHLENDILKAFDVEWQTARRIVRKMGSDDMKASVSHEPDGRARMVAVENREAHSRQRRVPVSSIEKVAQLRLYEIFTMVKEELLKADAWRHVSNRVILSGGGALIPGIGDIATVVFQKQAITASLPASLDKGLFYNDARDIVPLGALILAHSDTEISESGQEPPRTKFATFMTALKNCLNW